MDIINHRQLLVYLADRHQDWHLTTLQAATQRQNRKTMTSVCNNRNYIDSGPTSRERATRTGIGRMVSRLEAVCFTLALTYYCAQENGGKGSASIWREKKLGRREGVKSNPERECWLLIPTCRCPNVELDITHRVICQRWCTGMIVQHELGKIASQTAGLWFKCWGYFLERSQMWELT